VLSLGRLVRCTCIGKAEQAGLFGKPTFPGGGASKPHRSKYIVVVDRFV